MKIMIQKIAISSVVLLLLSQIATAEPTHKVEKKITIAEMELQLAKLGAEIAKEKVVLYQKEALLYEMKLDLMRKKKEVTTN